MKTPMTWLLAGAALTLCAGASVAFAEQSDQSAARQAEEDSRSALVEARSARDDVRSARDEARSARDDARDTRDAARDIRIERGDRDVRIYRNDHDTIVIHGGDRSETLSTMLQLRPEQRSALNAFVEATRSHRDGPQDHMVRFDRGTDQKTTLQRLDEMQAKAAEQRAEMDRKVAAIKSFYGQLDARQKKAFDAMPMLMMVGPNIGPMMIPRPIPIGHYFERRDFAVPPIPPVPPVPPPPPRI